MTVNKRLCSLLLVFALVFTSIALMPTGVYAASKKPAKVKNVAVTAVGDSYATLSWSKVKKAKKYQVYVSKKSKKKGFKKAATVKDLTSTIGGLAPNKSYWFKVRAVNGKKKGKYSKVVKVTTASTSYSSARIPEDFSQGATHTWTSPDGVTIQIFLPNGFVKEGDYKWFEYYDRRIHVWCEVGLRESQYYTVDEYINTYPSGEMRTYGGISGYEVVREDFTRIFAFQVGQDVYYVESSCIYSDDRDRLFKAIMQNFAVK